jgi:uncharacterized membrane protein
MIAGSVGILAGGLATFPLLFRGTPELWRGWGCLSASWTGGSANMIAVKEILNAPDSLFSNLIIMDTVIAYSWMAFLVFMSKYQAPINRKLKIEEENAESTDPAGPEESARIPRAMSWGGPASKISNVVFLLGISFAAGYLCRAISGFLPELGAVFNRFTWTVILATILPLALSMTPLRNLENAGASGVGNFLLYLLLTSIGARANLFALVQAPLFILAGFLWVSIHGAILFGFGRLFRIPVSLLAAASQANVGGTVSAPIVAGVYNRNYAPLGLVLAVLGNIYGTAFGLLFAEICRRLANLL